MTRAALVGVWAAAIFGAITGDPIMLAVQVGLFLTMLIFAADWAAEEIRADRRWRRREIKR